ncbi:hypothetical protein JCM10207_002990 [Rhodosporidiobolus poonsookiae]
MSSRRWSVTSSDDSDNGRDSSPPRPTDDTAETLARYRTSRTPQPPNHHELSNSVERRTQGIHRYAMPFMLGNAWHENATQHIANAAAHKQRVGEIRAELDALRAAGGPDTRARAQRERELADELKEAQAAREKSKKLAREARDRVGQYRDEGRALLSQPMETFLPPNPYKPERRPSEGSRSGAGGAPVDEAEAGPSRRQHGGRS